MRKLSYWAGLLLGLLLLSACEQQDDSTVNSLLTAITGRDSTVNAEQYYALRPADNHWPANAGQAGLSEHLLASNYYIILDASGSMEASTCAENSNKMQVAKTALMQFVQQIPAQANVGLFSFDIEAVSERVPLSSGNRDAFFNAVQAVRPGGNTPLLTSIRYAYQQLQAQAAKQLGYGEYHLVIITDGIATLNEAPDSVVQTILQQSPVVIHSIGFCIDARHSLNQPGMTYYTAANNAQELQRGLQAVLAEATDFNSDLF